MLRHAIVNVIFRIELKDLELSTAIYKGSRVSRKCIKSLYEEWLLEKAESTKTLLQSFVSLRYDPLTLSSCSVPYFVKLSTYIFIITNIAPIL
jgi:hypothetical protein